MIKMFLLVGPQWEGQEELEGAEYTALRCAGAQRVSMFEAGWSKSPNRSVFVINRNETWLFKINLFCMKRAGWKFCVSKISCVWSCFMQSLTLFYFIHLRIPLVFRQQTENKPTDSCPSSPPPPLCQNQNQNQNPLTELHFLQPPMLSQVLLCFNWLWVIFLHLAANLWSTSPPTGQIFCENCNLSTRLSHTRVGPLLSGPGSTTRPSVGSSPWAAGLLYFILFFWSLSCMLGLFSSPSVCGALLVLLYLLWFDPLSPELDL